jgi:hypothetical protein
MDETSKPKAIVGQMARVEPCPCGNSVILTVGPVSLRLDMAAANDVIATLGQALRSIESDPPPSDGGRPRDN